MEKNISASASCISYEGTVDEKKYSPEEAVRTVLEIIGDKGEASAKELSKEEYRTIRNCLVSIGSDNINVSEDNSLEGKEEVKHVVEGAGLTAEAVTTFQVRDAWGCSRHEWSASMGVRKVEGEALANALNYTFHFISFGTTEENKPMVLLDTLYERTFENDSAINTFNKGEFFYASEFDVSKHAQWGYLAFAQCAVATNEGTIIL